MTARWPVARPASPLVAATVEELIAGSYAWHEVCPRRGRGDPAWERWRQEFLAWCAARGTDPVELLRLRRDAKLREGG